MYRKPGSPGVLKGVLSGPYAGDKRVIDAAKLPRAARRRLADALTGRADPTPILHEHPSSLASRFRATWGLCAAMVTLATLTAMGFADPNASWAYQPRELALGYAAGAMLFAFSLLALFRRRALASGGMLVPGRYLLPLDIVEVPSEGEHGEQLVIVTPLGRGRDARIREGKKRSELVITFDDGSEIAFMLREEREGEHALRRLEHAQTILEELTYARDLEKSHANDAFFDVRVDDSWASLAPSGPTSGAAARRRALIHGRIAAGATLALGAALGWGAFAGRNWASDRALYLRALRIGTTESLDTYLLRATAHREDAADLRQRLLDQRAELAKRAQESRARTRPGFEPSPRPTWELTAEEAAARRGTAGACIASLRSRANPAHAEVFPIMERLVLRAERTGDPIIPVRLEVRGGSRPSDAPELALESRASRTVWAFERVLSELCPAALVKLVLRPLEHAGIGAPSGGDSGLDVKIDVSWPPAPTWKRAGLLVHAPKIAFDVTLHGEAITDLASFRLTMPPPDEPPKSVRDRSLFVVPASASETNVYPLLTARAFDRLYDELYGLFFAGDPRVPLREEEEEGAPKAP